MTRTLPLGLSVGAGDLTLELAPAFGGSVAAFRHGNFDLMRPMVPPDGAAPDALHAAMFPMVPFVNCIRDNRFEIDGRRYLVPRNMTGSKLNFHGSGWRLPWQVVAVGKSHAVLRLDSADRDDVFSYRAEQVFELTQEALSVRLGVVNTGAVRMPFSLGLHPWFPRHGEALVQFAATGIWEADHHGQTVSMARPEATEDHSRPRAMPETYWNRCYSGWDGRASVIWPRNGLSLEIAADTGLAHLMTHVPASAPDVFCLEPQTVPPCGFDGLERDEPVRGLRVLAPGERTEILVRFSVARQEKPYA